MNRLQVVCEEVHGACEQIISVSCMNLPQVVCKEVALVSKSYL
jgi:hypothetical protein